jgi:CBS domain-containing protein
MKGRPPAPRTVGEVMRRNARTVPAGAPLGDVLDAVTSSRMNRAMNRAIVVDAERRVLGVVSDEDLLARLDPAAEKGLLGTLMGGGSSSNLAKVVAADLMRTPPVTVTADTPLPDAVRVMLESRRKVLPITDAHGILAGVVDRSDLLRQATTKAG